MIGMKKMKITDLIKKEVMVMITEKDYVIKSTIDSYFQKYGVFCVFFNAFTKSKEHVTVCIDYNIPRNLIILRINGDIENSISGEFELGSSTLESTFERITEMLGY